jgi:hypothetical protein
MKTVRRDIVGKQFGSLIVLDEFIQVGNTPHRRTKWLCECTKCGSHVYVLRECLINRVVDYCDNCRPSGVRNERLYHIYYGMRQRCYNPNNKRYEHYGGRGITLCDEWLNGGYDVFKKWSIEHGYQDGMSIDRIDKDKDYCPENCEWVSLSENTSRGNSGMVKNHSKIEFIYAVDPSGNRIDIDNILAFSRKTGLNYSGVNAAIRGRSKRHYNGYEFHSGIIG